MNMRIATERRWTLRRSRTVLWGTMVALLCGCRESTPAASKPPEIQLLDAVDAKNVEKVKKLLNEKVDVNFAFDQGRTALHRACDKRSTEIAILLIENGANVTVATRHGETPLHSAAGNGLPKVVKALIDGGADVAARTDNGDTPLMLACRSACMPCVVDLLEHGADVNGANEAGVGPLHEVCFAGSVSKDDPSHAIAVAETLLSRGADVNRANKVGDTPLHWTALHGCVELAKLFLKQGADPTLRNQENDRAADIAIKEGWPGFVDAIGPAIQGGSTSLNSNQP